MFDNKPRTLIAALALTAAAFVGAGTVATVAPATAAPIVRLAAPTEGELTAALALALDTGASRADRAGVLEAGDAGLAVVDGLAGRIALIPSYRWYIVGPVRYDGDTATTGLKLALDGYEDFPLIDISFRQINGTWKLTNESLCTLAGYGSVPCNV